MQFIKKGYSLVSYSEFVDIIQSAFKESDESYVDMSVKLNAKSPGTVQNAFNRTEQKLSDVRLSKFASLVGVDSYIIYGEGEKGYLVNNNCIN